ncbi:MAG: ABC transporter ATP-binding protein [Armatimonadetes bacterium]|nr:ABC transporter ATP-binding protein [Armatimonadota bacterium]
MSLLSAENLGHRFDQGWLFRHVSFDLVAGDRLIVLGHNGSGKSTMLRGISRHLTLREGVVRGSDRIGYAALDLALYPQLTAREHLEYAGALRGVPARVEELLGLVGLAEAIEKRCGAMSTGMRARMKLALAIQHSPDVLVLDEPTAALDEQGRAVVDAVVHGFAGACLIATNDPEDRRWATHELDLG